MRKYFVSYSWANRGGAGGYGCLELDVRLPIRDMADIHVLIKEVRRITKFHKVVILNWRRFEEPAALLGSPKASEAS
jgi:hypothetical protein